MTDQRTMNRVRQYDDIVEAAARSWNVDPNMIRAVMHQESGGSTHRNGAPITGSSGEGGIMQFMPATARAMGIRDPHNPTEAIWGGAKYLRLLLDKFGDPTLAVAGYNAGENGVNPRTGAMPEKTRNVYVPAVVANYRAYSGSAPPARQVAAAEPDIADFLRQSGGVMPDGAPPPAAQPQQPAPRAPRGTRPAAAPAQPQQPVAAPPQSTGEPDIAEFLKQSGGVMPDGQPAASSPTPSAPVPTQAEAAREVRMPAQYGPPRAPVRPENSLAAIGNAIGRGAVQGYGPLPANPLDPLNVLGGVDQNMRAIGVYGPQAGQGTVMQRVNEAVLNPLAAGAGLALAPVNMAFRGLSGAFRGAQSGVAEAGAQAGMPQLGRDIAAMPEAFMAGGPQGMAAGGTRAPRVETTARPDVRANPLAPNTAEMRPVGAVAVAPEAVPPRNPLAPDFIPPGTAMPVDIARRDAPAFVPPSAAVDPLTGRVSPIVVPRQPEGRAAVGDGPQSVGAAAAGGMQRTESGQVVSAPPNIADYANRREYEAHRRAWENRALNQTHRDRAPNMLHPDEIIPGSRPTLGQQNLARAAEEDVLRDMYPEPFKVRDATNNEARVMHYEGLAPDDIGIERLKAARDAQAARDLAPVWANAREVDLAPVVAEINRMLGEGAGKRAVVGKELRDIRESMSAGSQLESNPQIVYNGIRKNIGDKLDRAKLDPASNEALAQALLVQIKEKIDTAMEAANPGFRQYLANYAEASRPIDEAQVLKGFRRSIVDTGGNMQLSRVQNMLNRIVKARDGAGANPYKSITDETMNRLFALRDDLAREAAARDFAKSNGSPTFKKTVTAARAGALSPVVEPAMHAAAILAGTMANPLAFGANLVIPRAVEKMRQRSAVKGERANRALVEQHLNPPTTPGP